jgi:pyruvate ferredoxin oxidoreductase delta subunit
MAEKSSKELEPGAMICEPGNAREYKTGDWRSKRPEVDKAKCTNCLFCWIYCPDNSVIVENEKMSGFKYSHCKGCGICANQCPAKAITMKEEGA